MKTLRESILNRNIVKTTLDADVVLREFNSDVRCSGTVSKISTKYENTLELEFGNQAATISEKFLDFIKNTMNVRSLVVKNTNSHSTITILADRVSDLSIDSDSALSIASPILDSSRNIEHSISYTMIKAPEIRIFYQITNNKPFTYDMYNVILKASHRVVSGTPFRIKNCNITTPEFRIYESSKHRGWAQRSCKFIKKLVKEILPVFNTLNVQGYAEGNTSFKKSNLDLISSTNNKYSSIPIDMDHNEFSGKIERIVIDSMSYYPLIILTEQGNKYLMQLKSTNYY